MATIIAVHQCLFCLQTFVTATEKDDHVLEHFAQETCNECDQKLIRIGGNLYTLHNAVTCIKIDVKIEKFTEASSPVNHSGYITKTEDDITASGSDNDDWSTTFSMIKESICVEERVTAESIDEFEQANVVLKNEDSDDFLLAPQMSNDNEIEIDPMQLNEVVDDIIEDRLECTQLDSENKPESDLQLTNSIKTNDEKLKVKCNICGKILLAVSLALHKRLKHSPPGTYICRTCHKEFPNEQELSKHQADCRRKKRTKLQCNDCGKMFSKSTIALHKRRMHSPKGTPVCKRCGKIFSNEEELSLHRSVYLLNRKPIEKGHFECDICKKVYPSKICIKQHMNWMHNPNYNKQPKILPCNICGKVLRKRGMSKHMASFHSDGSTYFCEICTKIFRNEAELLSHKTKCVHDHRQTVEPFNSQQKSESDLQLTNSIKTNDEKRKVECNICGKILLAVSLALHKRLKHSPPGTYICRTCHKELPNEQELFKHQADCRRKKRTKLQCHDCGKMFSKSTIARHMRTMHSPEGTPVCDRCGKILPNKDELAEHVLECRTKIKQRTKELYASRIGEFKCNICGNVYNLQLKLERHIKRCHQKRTSVACDICGKFVASKTSLRQHKIVKHSEEGTPICRLCKKAFPTEQELLIHKPDCKRKRKYVIEIVCDVCGKTLYSKPAFAHHKITFHSETPVCNICLKEFSNQDELSKHKKSCILIKKYKCHLCGQIRSIAFKKKHLKFCQNRKFKAKKKDKLTSSKNK